MSFLERFLSGLPSPRDAAVALCTPGKWIWKHIVSVFWQGANPWGLWLSLGLFFSLVGLLWLRTWGRHHQDGVYRRPRLHRIWYRPEWGPALLGIFGTWCIVGSPIAAEFRLIPRWQPTWLRVLQDPWIFWILDAGVVLVVAAVFWALRRRIRTDKETGSQGSAAWAAWSEIERNNDWRYILPLEVHYRGSREEWGGGAGVVPITIREEVACSPILIEGNTGSGKGMSILSHFQKSCTTPWIYNDYKAEVPNYQHLWNKTGRRPILFGAGKPQGLPTMRWNPVREVLALTNAVQRQSAWALLAEAIVPVDNSSGAAQNWVERQCRKLLALFLETGRYPTLGELSDAVLFEGIEVMVQQAELPSGVKALLEGKNVREYMTGAFFDYLRPFAWGWGRDATCGHDFALEEMLRYGGYVLAAESNPEQATPIRILWAFIFDRVLSAPKGLPLALLLDEGIATGRIPKLKEVLNTVRSQQTAVVFVIQGVDMLASVYGEIEARAILSSFGTRRITLLRGLASEGGKRLVEESNQYTETVSQPSGAGRNREERNARALITRDDVKRRGSKKGSFWGVVSLPDTTKKGHDIIGRLVPGPWVVTMPSREERERLLKERSCDERPTGQQLTDETRITQAQKVEAVAEFSKPKAIEEIQQAIESWGGF